MADDNVKPDETTGTVPVEEMIPHPDSDWAEWMDRPEPYYEGKPPPYQSDLPGAQPEDGEQAPDKPQPDKNA